MEPEPGQCRGIQAGTRQTNKLFLSTQSACVRTLSTSKFKKCTLRAKQFLRTLYRGRHGSVTSSGSASLRFSNRQACSTTPTYLITIALYAT